MVIILLTTDAKNEVVAVAYGFQTWAPDFRTRSSRIIIRGGFVKRTVTRLWFAATQDYETRPDEGTNCSYYTSAFKEFLVDR